jgi:peptidase S41-like protein
MSAKKMFSARVTRARAHSSARKRGAARSKPITVVQAKNLSWGERLDILDALCQVLDGVYAHLTLKRALYGVDVLRGLEHLRQQVPTMSDLQFHRELASLINRLRDAHTQYQGPWTVKDAVASLPFLVESFGPYDQPTYVVSKVDRRSVHDPHFVEGVTIDYWNGIPFDRAVELHAEAETGGRPDSRRARALESLTFRALEYAPPPNEEWVVLGYRDLKGKTREVRLDWEGFDPERVAAASRTLGSRIRRAINPAAEAVRRAKKYRFNHELWKKEDKAGPGTRAKAGAAVEFADFLTARTVTTRHGKFGYLRIWSFDVDDDQTFLDAAVTLMRRLPDRGLIIDLRDNPGGLIWAAERMLQLFTPHEITPTKFALRATPLTAAMARAVFNQAELAPWAESLFSAEQTGEPYSSHLPITPVELCNDIGQRYGGPVVVVVDANTYSSGDLFTAGILDNRIGPVICIGEATGAGGANVWDSEDLRAALNSAKRPLPSLPAGVGFTIAVRRAVRSGDADGTLIEDAGVPGQPYIMTRQDVFGGNRDLIERCGELLASQPFTRLVVHGRRPTLTVETVGLDQLDLYVDGHPGGVPIYLRGDGNHRVVVPAAARRVEVVGFSSGVVFQRRRVAFAERS